jgi:hypothetical protein
MKKIVLSFLLAVSVLFGHGQDLIENANDQVLLTPKESNGKNLIESFFEFYNIEVVEHFDKLNVYLVKANDYEDFYDNCQASGLFQIVEKDRVDTLKMDYLPNDPEFASCWHLAQSNDKDIDADEAWDLLPDGQQWVSVAMFDGGLDLTHPDLAGNTDSPFNAVNGTTNVGYVNSFDNHGTACSGTIAAVTNNGVGVSSVGNNKVKVMPVNIMSAVYAGGSFNTSTAIQVAAVNAAMANPNCVAIAMSYGGSNYSATLENAFLNARANGRGGKGMMVFASSGNGYSGTAAQYPANYNGVWGVGATTSSDVRSSYSNFGQICDISAPGSTIRTTDRVGADGYNSTSYTTINGTSFSCPITAAASAVIAYKNWELTDDEILSILSSTCDKVGGYSYTTVAGWPYSTRSNELGYGRINLKNAVVATPGPGSPPPPPPAPKHNFFVESLNVTPSVVNLGEIITVAFNVKTTQPNLDPVQVSTQYRYSTNSTWGDNDDIIIGTCTSILGDSIASESEAFTYTVGGFAGMRYILAKANFDNAAIEETSSDNTSFKAFTVNDPSFLGTDIKVEFSMPIANPLTTSAQVVNMQWRITNLGTTAVTQVNLSRRWVTCPTTGFMPCANSSTWNGVLLPGQSTLVPGNNSYNSINLCHPIGCAIPVGSSNIYRVDVVSVNGFSGDGNPTNNRVELPISRITTAEEGMMEGNGIEEKELPISTQYYTITGVLLDITKEEYLPFGIYIAKYNYTNRSETEKIVINK